MRISILLYMPATIPYYFSANGVLQLLPHNIA